MSVAPVYCWDDALLPGDRAKDTTSSVTLDARTSEHPDHRPVSARDRNRRWFWLPNGLDLEWTDEETGPTMKVFRDGYCFNLMIPFLRGFLYDLGLHERVDPLGDNVLVRNEWEGCETVRWPKVIDDDVWEAMYQIEPPEAIPSGENFRSGYVPMRDFGDRERAENPVDLLLGRLPFHRLLLQTTSSPECPSRIWSPVITVDGGHTQHGTWEELVDSFFWRACVVRRSDLDRWMEENVVRGTFLLPTPEEVGVYRMLGERLPLLWPDDRFQPWFEENRLRSDYPS